MGMMLLGEANRKAPIQTGFAYRAGSLLNLRLILALWLGRETLRNGLS